MTARLDARPSTRLVRASRDYRLARPEELPLETRHTLERSMPEGQLAGVLVSRAGGLADRAVDQAGAALFGRLAEPSDAVEAGLAAADLVGPVLDGVLEIESDAGWVSGPSAYRVLGLTVPTVGDDGCSVASVTALRRAARFSGRDVTSAWVRLYCSGRLPMSPAWADQVRVAGGVERFATSGAGRALRRHWSGPGSDDAKGWLIWRHLDPSRRRAVSWGEKLYVGVRPDDVPAAVAAVAVIGGELGLPAFKIAAQPIGLRRSDKIVLYCQDAAHRDKIGQRLARALDGADPQPVPFTSALVALWARVVGQRPARPCRSAGRRGRAELAYVAMPAARRVARRRRRQTRAGPGAARVRARPPRGRGRRPTHVHSLRRSLGCGMSTLTEPFVLPTDLVLVEPGSLPPSLRDAVGEDEVALTRPRGRSTSGVVDRSIADLLEEFREPRTIVDAVLRFARSRDLDPEQALADTYPALRRCLGERFLVPADGERTIEPLSKPGDLVGDATVLACIQVLEDVELHRGELADGTAVAIKVVRSTRARAAATTEREATLLSHLAADPTPRLLSSGDLDGRQYLVIEWREGLPVTSAAQLADDAGRLELARAVVVAYERLHARGVVHGDVHPGNTVVGPDGVVTLLDLGLARRVDGGEPARAPRGGILSYLDPEYAAGQRAGHAPQATIAGELFSVATLVYEVLAGAHRVDLGVDESEALRRLAEDEADVTAALGSYGPVAGIVQAMVGLDAAARPSLGDLASALESVATQSARPAVASRVPSRTAAAAGLDRLVDRVVARLGADGPMLDAELPAPTASVFYGAAGIAYGLLRIAIAREDADLLEAARLWCDRALIEAGRPEGFVAPGLQIDESITGLISPYHRESGVHLVRALVAYAAGDLMTAANAAMDFVTSSHPLAGEPELTLGLSGTVLGAAMLVDALGADGELDLSMVRALGDEALASAWRDLDLLGPVADGPLVQPGIAHGWAGVALAALRWRRSTGSALPTRLVGRLDELADLALPAGRGLVWPWVIDPHRSGPPQTMTGWCSGSAGYAQLWLAAASDLGGDRWFSFAERAGLAVIDAPADAGMLCCGAGGQAYALLALHRATSDDRWLRAATQLATRAAARASVGTSDLRDSLFKGELGVAVLAAELTDPRWSSMPFVDAWVGG